MGALVGYFTRRSFSELTAARDQLMITHEELLAQVSQRERVESQLRLDLIDTGNAARRVDNPLGDHRARRTPHRGQAVQDLHARPVDLDVVHEPELDDVHPELGILDPVQRLDDVFARYHPASVETEG